MQDYTSWARFSVLSTMKLLRPHDLENVSKVRVGRHFDGGYVMLDMFDEVDTCYSLGINDDVSWDLDMARRGAQIYQYDPTIECLPQEHENFHWSPLWIGDEIDEAAQKQTLAGLVERNGHLSNRNMVLKCDIEGAEWPMLQCTPNAVLRCFSQIVMEIHGMTMLTDLGHTENMRAAFLNLTSSHHVVHVHANNHSPWIVAGGVPVPETLELTLARKDAGRFTPSNTRFPTALDMPCERHTADLELGRFDFG